MSDDLSIDQPRPRRSGPEAKDRAAVRQAVAGIVGRFQALQQETAFLNAALARPTPPDDLFPRIVTLGQQVSELFGLLDSAVATLAPEQQDHSRIRDLRRALDHMRSAVPRQPEQAVK